MLFCSLHPGKSHLSLPKLFPPPDQGLGQSIPVKFLGLELLESLVLRKRRKGPYGVAVREA